MKSPRSRLEPPTKSAAVIHPKKPARAASSLRERPAVAALTPRKKKKKAAVAAPTPRKKKAAVAPPASALVVDVRALIEGAREHVAQAVNVTLVLLNWQIGRRIARDIPVDERALHGNLIVATLSRLLSSEYGKGFTRDALFRMVQFAELFPDEKVVATLSRQCSWSHFVELITIDDPLRRDFYAEMCRIERWSVRALRAKIDGLMFERTAIAKKPEEVVKREIEGLRREDKMTPDLVFRDPYVLDFLGLGAAYNEQDVEVAILRELEQFLTELGTDFAFVARQKRIIVDRQDYHLDLLFFHRSLRRLVAVELKLGRFQASDKGQMELYLRWLDAHERRPGEEPPMGLILCAGKSTEHVELLRLGESGIRIAEYVTELPSRELLQTKLHQAIRLARERAAASSPQASAELARRARSRR